MNSLKLWKNSKRGICYPSVRPRAFARFAQWLIRPWSTAANKLRWRNYPDKIHYLSHYNLRNSALVLFKVTVNYLFSKYRPSGNPSANPLDKICQIRLNVAVVEMWCMRWSLHRVLQTWSSCWAGHFPITCAWFYSLHTSVSNRSIQYFQNCITKPCHIRQPPF